MLSQSDRTSDTDVLTEAKRYVKERFEKPGRVFLGLVHRLDRPVSGLMVLARTSKAAARLSGQFRSREVEKKYVAIVEGKTEQGGRQSTYLKRSGQGVTSASSREEGAQYSELTWAPVSQTYRGTIVSVDLV
ncbi:MAG: RNA pseudouridine synthase, partial [Rhodothermales bacterium]|nr:RNA pseudouridine synthase [Rhodothermales bacterium]